MAPSNMFGRWYRSSISLSIRACGDYIDRRLHSARGLPILPYVTFCILHHPPQQRAGGVVGLRLHPPLPPLCLRRPVQSAPLSTRLHIPSALCLCARRRRAAELWLDDQGLPPNCSLALDAWPWLRHFHCSPLLRTAALSGSSITAARLWHQHRCCSFGPRYFGRPWRGI
jgi:hypothetical protein